MNPRTLSLCLLIALLGAARAWSQCQTPPADDGFAVGCCMTPTFVQPHPPSLTVTANWGVYNACALGYTATGLVTIGGPIWVLCDYSIIPITIQLPNLAPVNSSVLGKYVRTWMEPDSSGIPRNVYRILINGDLPIVPSTLCPAPACVPPCTGSPYFRPAHMMGHIDYKCDPTVTGGFSVAFSLSHLPGCIQHASYSTVSIPALATSPYSYHLVGPAPFSFMQVPEPQGTIIGDSMRASTLFFTPFTYLCHGEAAIVPGGSLTTMTANCLCGPLLNGPWRHQTLNASSCCFGAPVGVSSLPISGTPLAPTGLAAFTVGQWNTVPMFPGNRTLVIYLAIVNQNLTCSPVLQPLSAMTGVGTTTTFVSQTFPQSPPPGCSASVAVARSFIDLENMLPLVYAGNTLPTPGLGSQFVSDLVISLNIF